MLRGGNYSLRNRLVEDKFIKQAEKKEEPPIESPPTITEV